MRKTNTPKTRELFIEDLGDVTGGGLPGSIIPGPITTQAVGEEDGGDDQVFTTLALGEEDGGDDPFQLTTLALGEEDGAW